MVLTLNTNVRFIIIDRVGDFNTRRSITHLTELILFSEHVYFAIRYYADAVYQPKGFSKY
ncbi:hypothetical protein DSL64_16010 [Dyadobacter luteus]|uniref:Uncharacterized protein n=1 Tax=Dyadobacter luteus TaxID=2259619 RepID=A0A3D8Y9M8_9BACT|nr:hypothetical protein DSL64_16010 [Dyadobacter luteus]